METAATAVASANSCLSRVKLADWIKIALVLGLGSALYIQIVPDLAVDLWTEPKSSYGLLIPPIVLYLAYLGRHRTLAVPAKQSLGGLWLVVLACLILLLGNLAAEFFLARISLIMLAAGLTWTFWGAARFRTLAFPFVLLATMVPLPAVVYNTAAAPLQLFASSVATDLAQVMGVSIYRDGNIIHLANASLGVAEACSGLHSLSAMIVASLLLGFVHEIRLAGRVLLLLLSAPLAIAINVLRVTGTALLADYQPDFAMGFYHSFTGWIMFVVGFGGLWLVSTILLRRIGQPVRTGSV
jgi:exosortase